MSLRIFARAAANAAIHVLLVAVTPALLPTAAHADLGGFTIPHLDVDLEVTEGAGLHVTERITVDFNEPRRGIYRTIPVRYTDPRGFQYSLGFRFEDAVDDAGRTHAAKVTSEGRYVKIRLGDPDVFRQGRVIYVLRYRIRDGLGHFPEHDELYWNASGHEWNVPIARAVATVRLPASIPADSLRTLAFTGPYGSVEGDADISFPEPGVIRFETRNALAPMEGLTVAASWPGGHVSFPGPVNRMVRFLSENWILLAPFLAFAGLFARYRAAGRDPEGPAAVQVRYEPPEGITAGELGALVDERVDLRDVTATIVDLAVRGALTIRMVERPQLLGLFSKEEPEFVRGELPQTALKKHERQVFNALFQSGDTVELKDLRYKFYRDIPKIRDAVYTELAEKKLFAGKPSTVRTATVGIGFLCGIAVVAVGIFWAMAIGAVMPNILVTPLLAGALTTILFAAFAPAMPRRTRAGVHLRAWAKGFEEFVDRVESEQLEADRRKQVFERLLPYAMALGIADKWAGQFEGIYDAGAGPAWYTGASPYHGLSTSHFERSLSDAMRSTGQSLTAAPRSSGSRSSGSSGFSGGSSGGGGGGGGGGSW